MARDACGFMGELARKQHAFWLGMLVWWIGVVILLSVVAAYFRNTLFLVLQAVVYASFIITGYILYRRVRRVQCPYCQQSAGAIPVWRYKFVICRTCKERIECRHEAKR
jgi:small-conductance mechanosensitive channel